MSNPKIFSGVLGLFKWVSWLCLLKTVSSQYNSYFSLQSAVDELQPSEFRSNYGEGLSRSSKPHEFPHDFNINDEHNNDDSSRYMMNRQSIQSLNKELSKFLNSDSRYTPFDLNEDIDDRNVVTKNDNQYLWKTEPITGHLDYQMASNKDNNPGNWNQLRSWYNRRGQTDDINKRSTSVFRERASSNDFQDLQYPMEMGSALVTNPELSNEFLREIARVEDERDQHESLPPDTKYHQIENNLDEVGLHGVHNKRLRVPPYYMLMQRKRSYPVLPWLPYSGPEGEMRKRFLIAKRSTSSKNSDSASISTRTAKNVEKELSALFETPSSSQGHSTSVGKHKRSTEVVNEGHSHPPTVPRSFVTPTLSPISTEAPPTQTTTAPADTTTEEIQEMTVDPTKSLNNTSEQHHHHHHHQHQEHNHHPSPPHQNSSSEESSESHEDQHSQGESEENEEDDQHHHDHDNEDEDDDDDDGEEDEEETGETAPADNANAEDPTTKTTHTFPLHLSGGSLVHRHKKSIDWSQYFGLDRKKKVPDIHKSAPVAKRNAAGGGGGEKDAELELQDLTWSNLNASKLYNMNQKLQSLEDSIIGDTIKYTGSHEGIVDPEEIQRLKDHVLSRLATVYSLEKLRRALAKLRLIVENQTHLQHNRIESEVDKHSSKLESKEDGGQDIGNSKGVGSEDISKERMKKSNSYPRYQEVANDFGGSHMMIEDDAPEDSVWPRRLETLNDAYLGNKNYILGTNQCPIIETMAERCRSLDLLIGDLNQDLLTLCGIHHICYLCGTTRVSCDYQFLEDADTVCGTDNRKCQAASRTLLLILRGSPGSQLGPRECVKNPCLYSAMREIGL